MLRRENTFPSQARVSLALANTDCCASILTSHLEVMSGQYNGFIWPVVAIWAFDRLIRYSRILISSMLSRSAKSMKAVATYDSKADIVRLNVSNMLFSVMPVYFLPEETVSLSQCMESNTFSVLNLVSIVSGCGVCDEVVGGRI